MNPIISYDLTCGNFLGYKGGQNSIYAQNLKMGDNKDSALLVSLVLSVVSLVTVFGVTWYFQASLNLLQQQVEYDNEQMLKFQVCTINNSSRPGLVTQTFSVITRSTTTASKG